MIYLSGVTNDTIEPRLIESGVGLMVQPGNGYAVRVERYEHWAADNGCFAAKWEEDSWLEWLSRLPTTALFAVSPDVYPNAEESLKRGLKFSGLLRGMGFRVAIVAQDGAERLSWPWDEMDCLFLGGKMGKPEWKTSVCAERLVHEARNAGKWVHMGRANSVKRLARAKQMGCLSADGTILKYGANLHVPWLTKAAQQSDAQGSLWQHESPSAYPEAWQYGRQQIKVEAI